MFFNFDAKQSYLYEEVICTEPSTLVSIPWLRPYRQMRLAKVQTLLTELASHIIIRELLLKGKDQYG
jgi:hypothetical protein